MRDVDCSDVVAKARNYMVEQAYPEAIAVCKEALADIEAEKASAENERRKMHILFCLSDICHVSGDWTDGLIYLATVRERAAKLAEPDILGESVIRSGDIYSKMGNWKKALDNYSEAERQVRRFTNKYLLGRVHVGRGTVMWRQGKYAAAMEQAELADAIGLATSNRRLIAMSASLKASIFFDRREYKGAIAQNDRAIAAAKALGDSIETARVMNNKGEVYKLMGDYQTARETFEEALGVLANSVNCRSLAYLHTNLAECHARQGMRSEAREEAALASRMVNMSQDKYIRSQHLMVQALIEHGDGHTAKALALISDAESLMSKLAIPYDLGVMHLEHARMLRGSDAKASEDEYRSAIRSFTAADNTEKAKIAADELASLAE